MVHINRHVCVCVHVRVLVDKFLVCYTFCNASSSPVPSLPFFLPLCVCLSVCLSLSPPPNSFSPSFPALLVSIFVHLLHPVLLWAWTQMSISQWDRKYDLAVMLFLAAFTSLWIGYAFQNSLSKTGTNSGRNQEKSAPNSGVTCWSQCSSCPSGTRLTL